ncbi:DUF3369 domain-containing protein [Thalassotalea profundi]|uniref:Response regulatory domain-containing protein n=1 Tax=Thalassotalea profundi TaxID=2036687 RepID=A0ABQ3IYV6_9GAMM|nr:DUF3369 domain-containing protein [Thalassotalea profundi]GHE97345.1 hypothetical protein GCM10011501_28630 [Thalassotalea profundi]
MDWLAEDTITTTDNTLPPWKVVIVDDDDEVHKITKMSLSSFEFEHKKLEFIHLYSGKDAKKYFSQHDDIALVFLDVVMESDHAGLDVVKYIREELDNHYTRIILRTGQPGTAPQNDVIKNYDIDGYKEKTKTTISTLNHAIHIALRSYRDLIRIKNYQKGLEALIDSINNMTQIDSVIDLSNAVLQQIKSVLNTENTHFLIKDSAAFSMIRSNNNHWNLSINESKALFVDDSKLIQNTQPIVMHAQQCFANKTHVIAPPYYCFYYQSKRGTETAFVIKCLGDLNSMSHKLIKLFSINMILTIENLLIDKNS